MSPALKFTLMAASMCKRGKDSETGGCCGRGKGGFKAGQNPPAGRKMALSPSPAGGFMLEAGA